MGINELQKGINDMIHDSKLQEDIHQQLAMNYVRAIQENIPEDPVNTPKHYRNHPSGIECIQITEHMGFNLGNAVKYIWRCDLKKDAIEDLKKAVWYIEREIKRRDAQ